MLRCLVCSDTASVQIINPPMLEASTDLRWTSGSYRGLPQLSAWVSFPDGQDSLHPISTSDPWSTADDVFSVGIQYQADLLTAGITMPSTSFLRDLRLFRLCFKAWAEREETEKSLSPFQTLFRTVQDCYCPVEYCPKVKPNQSSCERCGFIHDRM